MMEKQTKKAIIAGASGLVGGFCLHYLLQNEAYSEVIALVRRNMAIDHPKLKQIVVDFDKLGETSDELTADEVFCCLGTTIKKAGSQEQFKKVDYHYPMRLAGLARGYKVSSFLLVSSLGADASSSVFYSRTKGELERDLKEVDFDALHILRPSLLLGDREEKRAGESIGKVVAKFMNPLMLGPFRKYRGIEAKNVAKAMVKIAQENKKGTYIYESDKIQAIVDEK